MEVGGTLQDSVMSYQLMHMYTALQCRHSGGFTLTFRTELHTLFERGHTSKTWTVYTIMDYFCSLSSVNPPGCHRLHKLTVGKIIGLEHVYIFNIHALRYTHRCVHYAMYIYLLIRTCLYFHMVCHS